MSFAHMPASKASCLKPRYAVLGSIVAVVLATSLALTALAGCSSSTNSSSNSNLASSDVSETIWIGTMPTEDFLPMWVAKEEGLFMESGIDVELESFDSAPALSAAIAANEIDMAMVDVMRAAKLCEAGTSVQMEWVTLGETPDQGAFGLLAPADAEYSDISGLEEWLASNPDAEGVGVAANTIPEYVFDKLCEEEGVDPNNIRTVEVASLPERYALVANGNLAAAALPNSLLALGEASGLKVLAIDSVGENLSESVMIATDSFASDNAELVEKVATVWNKAAEMINSDPESYRSVLIDNANLNDAIAEDYKISTYPLAIIDGSFQHPTADYVESMLNWMAEKGYSSKQLRYDSATGSITVE